MIMYDNKVFRKGFPYLFLQDLPTNVEEISEIRVVRAKNIFLNLDRSHQERKQQLNINSTSEKR